MISPTGKDCQPPFCLRKLLSLFFSPGFSFVEVLVSLFLIICLLWGTLPQFQKYRKGRELDLASSLVRQTISLARQMAVSERRDYQVFLEEGGSFVSIVNPEKPQEIVGKVERLPSGIIIRSLSPNLTPLVFQPHGGLKGISGSITLEDQRTGKETRIVVYNLTGTTKVVEK